MINIRDGKRGGIYGSEKNPREEECFDKSEETIKRKQMCETDRVGKSWLRLLGTGCCKGVIFLLFQPTQLLASGCAYLSTYQD